MGVDITDQLYCLFPLPRPPPTRGGEFKRHSFKKIFWTHTRFLPLPTKLTESGSLLLWAALLRGLADRLLGGIGFRVGRRHPEELDVGDALDFWRVLAVEPPHRLLLLAEMKLPGEAVLGFTLTGSGERGTELRQVARFLPRGLGGLLYWYALEPFHHWVYRGMLKAIARKVGKPMLAGPDKI